MVKKRKLSPSTRSAIVTLHKEQYSLRRIMKKLNLRYRPVQGIVKRYQGSGSTASRRRIGRKKITTPADELGIELISYKRSRRRTIAQNRAEFNACRQNPLPLNSEAAIKRPCCCS